MGPIIVRQVIGEQEQQKVLDIHVVVPDPKPAIEQIVDVFVKNVGVNSVDVITNKVIVRGELEIKAIYVACVPNQAVHAVEVKNYKWTQDVPINGATRGMDAEGSVAVEFVDYDVASHTRAYQHKYGMQYPDEEDDDEGSTCGTTEAVNVAPCTEAVNVAPCTEAVSVAPCPEAVSEAGCVREFDVSVVLKITAKVLADREIQLGGGGGGMPVMPKG